MQIKAITDQLSIHYTGNYVEHTGWPKSKYTVIKLFFICFEVTCSALYATC